MYVLFGHLLSALVLFKLSNQFNNSYGDSKVKYSRGFWRSVAKFIFEGILCIRFWNYFRIQSFTEDSQTLCSSVLPQLR